MKKGKAVVLFLSCLLVVSTCVIVVSALSTNTHGFELKAVLCPMERYSEFTDGYEYDECAKDYLAGNLNDYVLSENDIVEPGSIVMVVQRYLYGGKDEVVAYRTSVNYDESKWDLINYEGYIIAYDNTDGYPVSRNEKWQAGTGSEKAGNVYTDGKGGYTRNTLLLNKDLDLSMFFLKLKDGVTSGSNLKISFVEEDCEMTKVVPNSLETLDFTTNNINLKVSGEDMSLKQIISSNYDIERDGDTPIIIGAEPKTKIDDFLNNLDNNKEELLIYDKDNNLITNYSNYVGSHMKLQLKVDGVIKDELTVVVRGDLDGNGKITQNDIMYVDRIYYESITRNYINVKKGDINLDGRITISDKAKLIDYYNKKIDTLN